MAEDYGLSLGFDSNSLIVALLITQFVGFPAALVLGQLGDRYGAMIVVFIAIAVYIGVTLWAMQMTEVREFYVLAVVFGLVQGGVLSLCRSLYARLIPANKSAEFFGFFFLFCFFVVVLGLGLLGLVGLLSGCSCVLLW